jgi:hypothetical protein
MEKPQEVEVSASVLYMSMSLDGYIAGPNDEPANPHPLPRPSLSRSTSGLLVVVGQAGSNASPSGLATTTV